MSFLSSLDVELLHAAVTRNPDALTPSSAKAIMKLGFSKKQKAEVEKLLDKNNRGTISTDERRTLERYVRVGDFLSLVQLRAKMPRPHKSAKP